MKKQIAGLQFAFSNCGMRILRLTIYESKTQRTQRRSNLRALCVSVVSRLQKGPCCFDAAIHDLDPEILVDGALAKRADLQIRLKRVEWIG